MKLTTIQNNQSNEKFWQHIFCVLFWFGTLPGAERKGEKNRVKEFRVFSANKWSTCLFAKCAAKQEPRMRFWWRSITDGEYKKSCVEHMKPSNGIGCKPQRILCVKHYLERRYWCGWSRRSTWPTTLLHSFWVVFRCTGCMRFMCARRSREFWRLTFAASL